MRKTRNLKASEARQQLDEVLDEVSRQKTRIIVEKSGSPIAAIVSIQDLEGLQRLEANAEQALARMRAAFSDLSEEQIVEDVARVIEEVRAERRSGYEAQAGR